MKLSMTQRDLSTVGKGKEKKKEEEKKEKRKKSIEYYGGSTDTSMRQSY